MLSQIIETSSRVSGMNLFLADANKPGEKTSKKQKRQRDDLMESVPTFTFWQEFKTGVKRNKNR